MKLLLMFLCWSVFAFGQCFGTCGVGGGSVTPSISVAATDGSGVVQESTVAVINTNGISLPGSCAAGREVFTNTSTGDKYDCNHAGDGWLRRPLIVPSTTAPGCYVFGEATTNGSNYFVLCGRASQSGNKCLVLPDSTGTEDQALMLDSSTENIAVQGIGTIECTRYKHADIPSGGGAVKFSQGAIIGDGSTCHMLWNTSSTSWSCVGAGAFALLRLSSGGGSIGFEIPTSYFTTATTVQARITYTSGTAGTANTTFAIGCALGDTGGGSNLTYGSTTSVTLPQATTVTQLSLQTVAVPSGCRTGGVPLIVKITLPNESFTRDMLSLQIEP